MDQYTFVPDTFCRRFRDKYLQMSAENTNNNIPPVTDGEHGFLQDPFHIICEGHWEWPNGTPPEVRPRSCRMMFAVLYEREKAQSRQGGGGGHKCPLFG